ncbi:MAG TPA: peptidoglycan-binding protein, partial [Candidatus Parcubacteria bacterium]|nr:peptidoglycan-binding protein [Candidatus Parcubacteria bacterium]
IKEFNLLVYSQVEGKRAVIVAKTPDVQNLSLILESQEPTLYNDLAPFLELVEKKEISGPSYFRNAASVRGYKGPNFRFLTLSNNDFGVCYLVLGDYFVLSTSWKSMQETISRLNLPGRMVELTQELKKGDSGKEVEILQSWLKEEGTGIYPEGIINGYFGPATERAVKRFQEKYAADILAPQGKTYGTGVVDHYTRIKLNELYATSGIIPPTAEITRELRYGDKGDQVYLLQTWLAKDPQIYPEKMISGWFGYLTQKAVIRFQEKYKKEILTPQGLEKGTGIVDAFTRKKLNELYGNSK